MVGKGFVSHEKHSAGEGGEWVERRGWEGRERERENEHGKYQIFF